MCLPLQAQFAKSSHVQMNLEGHTQAPIESSMRLPVELLVIVAHILLGDGRLTFRFRCQPQHCVQNRSKETQSALYTTIEWDCERFCPLAQMVEDENAVERIAGWKQVK